MLRWFCSAAQTLAEFRFDYRVRTLRITSLVVMPFKPRLIASVKVIQACPEPITELAQKVLLPQRHLSDQINNLSVVGSRSY